MRTVFEILRYTFHSRERTKSLEEELHKVKAARSVDDLQRKELEDQLEAEQYFTTLYKTQVRELTDEVDEAKERQQELEREKEILVNEFKGLAARADNEAMAKRVAEEDIAELEKEKMMVCNITNVGISKGTNNIILINLTIMTTEKMLLVDFQFLYVKICRPLVSIFFFWWLFQTLHFHLSINGHLSLILEIKCAKPQIFKIRNAPKIGKTTFFV